MTLHAVLLLVGIALLIGGGDAVVRGAVALAQCLGVSALVIGLTVVAFGTSAPELAVNVIAALRGNGDVAFGNIIGSNLANVGLVLGCAAMLGPIRVRSVVVTREIPMLLLACAVSLVLGVDAIRGESRTQYDRAEGLLLLLLFGVFLYYTIGETLRDRPGDPLVEQARDQSESTPGRPLGWSLLWFFGGLIGLTAGGQWTVSGAVGIAEALEVPGALIGLTVIAVGTSLPELSTTLIASRRGESDLAMGNVVGSSLFNLLFVLGVTAVIHPVPIPARGQVDLAAMMVLALILFALSNTSRRRILRYEGGILVAAYVGYLVWRSGH